MEDVISKYFTSLAAFSRKKALVAIIIMAMAGAFFYFVHGLGAVSDYSAEPKTFEVREGDGFRGIVDSLESEGLIRSSVAFKILSVITGSASKFKPGFYQLSSRMTSYQILHELVVGSHREVTVKIPEGASVYEVDQILSDNKVLKKGDLISSVAKQKIEGRLFPDTYKFFTDSGVEEVTHKFLTNFELRTKDLSKQGIRDEDIILASLLEKEVPDFDDRMLVAGILKKRLAVGIPLQIDATICYIKVAIDPNHDVNCYPLSPLDFKIPSDYNTYLHRGLPPSPIGNPGSSAMRAALNPKSSAHLFYLSDPKTKKTIFAKTLEEQIKNKIRYLQK